MNNQAPATPFLKWAGGKTQLLPQIFAYLPPELLAGQITRYVEPFIGGGAVFFALVQRFSFSQVVLADQNPDLILAYRTVQTQVEALIERLAALERAYLTLSPEDRKAYYYQTRARFNQRQAHAPPEAVARTALLIFLNRTCYNGLFRVNAKGEFNVPFGRYKNPRICDQDNLRTAARTLEGVALRGGDFAGVGDVVDAGTFVYFDPPYRPLSKTASFNAYAAAAFDDRAQTRLARFFRSLDQTGARLMLSNADPHNIDPGDDFFERLYQGFALHKVRAHRRINSQGGKRGPITELLILNYRV